MSQERVLSFYIDRQTTRKKRYANGEVSSVTTTYATGADTKVTGRDQSGNIVFNEDTFSGNKVAVFVHRKLSERAAKNALKRI